MDAKALNQALDDLGWTGADLAVKCAAHPVTVSSWRTGKARIPGAVAAYLTLARDLQTLARSVRS